MKFFLLKRTRVIVALLFFSFTLFSFLDIYEFLSESIVSKILFLQFIPSLLKFIQILSITSFGFLVVILLTAIIGRFYCSSICPFGILQDMFSFIAKKISNKRRFFKYRSGYTKTRYVFLIIAVIGILFGISAITILLDPYSNAGRVFTFVFKPVVVVLNNAYASIMQANGNFTFKIFEVKNTSVLTIVYSLLVFIVMAYFSFKRGRIICNTVCPVGTLLGLFSNKALLKIQLDTDSCTKCGKCTGVCKSECINIKTQEIDYSRCVLCFDCLTVCNDNAIDFKLNNRKHRISHYENENRLDRRSAISALLALSTSTSVLANGVYKDVIGNKIDAKGEYTLSLKKNPVSPPGSKGIERFNSICTACGLCISVCPTNVLQPAIKEYGILGLMQPHMDYVNAGFCNYDCNRCGNVCPTGAILPLAIEEKQLTQLGKAVFVQNNCVVYRDETACGACSEHCPTKAVDMVPYKDGLVIPKVNQDICIGCGACEHPCPAEYPHKAIYVEGNVVHQVALKPKDEKSDYQELEEDFPF